MDIKIYKYFFDIKVSRYTISQNNYYTSVKSKTKPKRTGSGNTPFKIFRIKTKSKIFIQKKKKIVKTQT